MGAVYAMTACCTLLSAAAVAEYLSIGRELSINPSACPWRIRPFQGEELFDAIDMAAELDMVSVYSSLLSAASRTDSYLILPWVVYFG